MSQLGFDIDALIRDEVIENLPEWEGAPLEYHEEYYLPHELQEAFDHWVLVHGHQGCIPLSQMWRVEWGMEAGTGHMMCWLLADGRGWFGKVPPVTGALMSQANCATCRWHFISADEHEVVYAFNDHAFPGWRDLPAVPYKMRGVASGTKSPVVRAWLEDHYPPGWGVKGAPVVTERVSPGTRDVPGYSPWGGFDICKKVEEQQ